MPPQTPASPMPPRRRPARRGPTIQRRRPRTLSFALPPSPFSLLLPPLILAALAALALLLVYARPHTQAIAVGGPGDRAATLGFFDRERTADGTVYRWTDDDSTLIFRAAGLAFPANQPVRLDLALAASRPAGVAPPRLTVAVNGRPVGAATVAGEARPSLPLGDGLPGNVDSRVTLTTADRFTPPGDRRQLGVAVLAPATLTQVSGGGLALPPIGAWWRWLATIAAAYTLALALARRAPRPRALAPVPLPLSPPVLATLAAAAFTLALALLATLDRARFWELIHLPLLALLALQPLAWRPDLARWSARALTLAGDRLALRPPHLALLAIPPLAAAQALLSARQQPILALALGTLGLLLALTAILGHVSRDNRSVRDGTLPPHARRGVPPAGGGVRSAPARSWLRSELLPLLAILALAAAARLWRLGDIPFGLWRDEARHGLVALRILDEPGYRPVYEPAISLPGLYPALLAADFRLFGASIASLRGLTAVAGVGAVAALWLVARQLWGPRVARVAALLGAVGSWRVSIDRLAFDTAPTTLCTLGAFAAFLGGVAAVRAGRRGLWHFAGAGLLGGLAIYGYYPGRFALPVLAGATLVLIARERGPFLRRAWPGLLLVAAVAALTLVPLARYALAEPDNFFRRTEQVYLLADRYLEGQTKLEAVERNLLRHVVMFNWEGEPNARHHAPRWPMLDAATAAAFALGLALALAAALRLDFAALFALGWLAALLAPSVVSVDAPSAVRAQDAAPAAYLLAALGLVALWERLAAADAPRWLRRAAPALVAAALALAVGINLWLYFVRLPGDPRVLSKFQYVGETRAGLAVAAARKRTPDLVVYTARPFVGSEVLAFASNRATIREFPTDPAALPPGPVLLLAIRSEDLDFDAQLAAARRLAAAHNLREIPGPPPPGGTQPTYIAFTRDP